jgi:hypothetical protein
MLHLHFLLAWGSYYAKFSYQGYESAMAHGFVPAFFNTSPKSLRISQVVLFFLPLVALWFAAGSRLKAALGLWIGVMLAIILIWISTKRLREDSDLWPIDVAVLSFQTVRPLVLGTVAQFGLQGGLRLFRTVFKMAE